MTVLRNPGSIGLSIAGVDDQFRVIANVMMMADRLFGDKTGDEAIESALVRRGLDATPDNVAKVRAYLKEPAKEPVAATT